MVPIINELKELPSGGLGKRWLYASPYTEDVRCVLEDRSTGLLVRDLFECCAYLQLPCLSCGEVNRQQTSEGLGDYQYSCSRLSATENLHAQSASSQRCHCGRIVRRTPFRGISYKYLETVMLRSDVHFGIRLPVHERNSYQHRVPAIS